MKTDRGGRLRRRVLLLLAFLLLATTKNPPEKVYKPVKAPMLPGVRKLAEQEQERRLRPYLGTAGGDLLFASDLSSEVGRGATNAAAALGNGRLSVQVSPWAELTVFRWPSPLYGDQLRYFTLPGTKDRPVRMNQEAPSPDWRRYGRPYDACPGFGSRGGLLLESGEMTWLGDPSWSSERSFTPENSFVLLTTLRRPDLAVEITDFVDPEDDILVRHFQVRGKARRFFYHATFAPRVPDPAEGADWDPKGAGFAAVYLAEEQVIVHFQPVKKARRFKSAPASAVALDQAYPEGGAFVAWGLAEPVAEFQVGADRCQNLLPKDAPPSAWEEASKGKLSNTPLFFGPVNAGLASELSAPGASITLFIAAGPSAEKAVGLIKKARAQGLALMRERAVSAWQEKAQRVHLPPDLDAVSRRVLTRSVLNVLVGQDRESGAIVASLSRQPPYHFDYPRDSAFFDLLLDLAGFSEAVTFHHQFLVRTQYQKRLGFSPVWMVNYRSPFFDPSGNWPQKMSTDGSSPTSFLAIPCEIDETALTVWNFWRHERALSPAERSAYVAQVQPALIRSAESLLKWVDLKKEWTRPAIEDDSFPPEATLHGVSSALTGLAAACDAGPRWNIPREKVEKYCAAARALKTGLRARTTFPETLDRAGFRGLAWSLWPAPAFDDYTEPGAQALKKRLAESIRKKSSQQSPGFAYLGEEIMALAMADQKTAEYRPLLERAFLLLTHEVAFPGTDCFGEITLWGDFAGTGERIAQQRTAIPHLWNGAAVYLAAIALYEPELLNQMRPPPP